MMILENKDSYRLLNSSRYARRAGAVAKGRAHSKINLLSEGSQPIVRVSGLFSI